MLFFKKRRPTLSPVLVIDALGIASEIEQSDPAGLAALSDRLDAQYYRFMATVPFKVVLSTASRVIGSGELSTFRLNDMFVLFGKDATKEARLRHLVASSMLFHTLLLEGFIPRGGLGLGLILRGRDSILGSGFIDAYDAAERRPDAVRDVCAVRVSERFLAAMAEGSGRKAFELLYFYEGHFFINPRVLVDPELGRFDDDRILGLLEASGANSKKLAATAIFLRDGEDFDAAARSGSKSKHSLRQRLDSIAERENPKLRPGEIPS